MFDDLPEADRGDMLALIYHEKSICPCGCGQFVDLAHSRDWNWSIEHKKCYAGAALDQTRRKFDKDHKTDEGRHDGRLWTVSPVKPA